MDKATRRELLSSVDASGRPKQEPARLSDLAGGTANGLEGVRRLEGSDWQAPADLEWQEEQDDWAIKPTTVEAAEKASSRSKVGTLLIGVAVFALAALARLYVLFFVTDPQNPGLGWYGDTFHHWQIAYLSKEVGFSHGFLRLWDFKGMEYFWGLLHPLVLAALFSITGSVDIVIPRLLSLLAGSISTVLVFLLARRYFNWQVGLAASLIAALNPVGVFSDASGMQEPLGVALLLAGFAAWPKRSVWTGILWSLAGMVRAEFWILGLGLVAATAIVEKKTDRRLAIALSWLVPSFLYMKYLLDKTGNPIYPVYWNFIGNAAGAWMANVPLNEVQTAAMWAFRAAALVSAVAAFWIVRKKPSYYLLFLLGLGNILLLSVLLGFSAYVRGFLPRFLVDRIFIVPYMFAGILLAALALYWLPRKRLRAVWISVGWASILVVLALSQWAWKPIWHDYEPGIAIWSSEHEVATQIASAYEGGVISIMEDRPWLTYFLVHDFGISGKNIEGQMYDPFAYIEGNPFSDWDSNREKIITWLNERNISLLVFPSSKANYQQMVAQEPALFRQEMSIAGGYIEIYRVTSNEINAN